MNAPRCNYWGKSELSYGRCPHPAEVALHGPDGRPVPGGYYCLKHAVGYVNEYAHKLGEDWSVTVLEQVRTGRTWTVRPLAPCTSQSASGEKPETESRPDGAATS